MYNVENVTTAARLLATGVVDFLSQFQFHSVAGILCNCRLQVEMTCLFELKLNKPTVI